MVVDLAVDGTMEADRSERRLSMTTSRHMWKNYKVRQYMEKLRAHNKDICCTGLKIMVETGW